MPTTSAFQVSIGRPSQGGEAKTLSPVYLSPPKRARFHNRAIFGILAPWQIAKAPVQGSIVLVVACSCLRGMSLRGPKMKP